MSTDSTSRRVIRDRYLTSEEAAEYAEIRRKVMQEFPPKFPNMKIGRQLQQLREQQGLTAEEAAEKAGISEATVREAEQGRDIPVSTLVLLADAMGCQLTVSRP